MARWKIDLIQTVDEAATVYVEAETQEQAEQMAIDRALTGIPHGVQWEFSEAAGDIEPVSAVKYPTAT